MPLTDVARWGYPAVLINLGVVVLIAVLLGAALRLGIEAWDLSRAVLELPQVVGVERLAEPFQSS